METQMWYELAILLSSDIVECCKNELGLVFLDFQKMKEIARKLIVTNDMFDSFHGNVIRNGDDIGVQFYKELKLCCNEMELRPLTDWTRYMAAGNSIQNKIRDINDALTKCVKSTDDIVFSKNKNFHFRVLVRSYDKGYDVISDEVNNLEMVSDWDVTLTMNYDRDDVRDYINNSIHHLALLRYSIEGIGKICNEIDEQTKQLFFEHYGVKLAL